MRYELRYAHKVIHIFDTHRYTAVDSFFVYEKDKAEKLINKLNRK